MPPSTMIPARTLPATTLGGPGLDDLDRPTGPPTAPLAAPPRRRLTIGRLMLVVAGVAGTLSLSRTMGYGSLAFVAVVTVWLLSGWAVYVGSRPSPRIALGIIGLLLALVVMLVVTLDDGRRLILWLPPFLCPAVLGACVARAKIETPTITNARLMGDLFMFLTTAVCVICSIPLALLLSILLMSALCGGGR